MKTILSALFALTVLAAVAAPASADEFNPRTYHEQLLRNFPI